MTVPLSLGNLLFLNEVCQHKYLSLDVFLCHLPVGILKMYFLSIHLCEQIGVVTFCTYVGSVSGLNLAGVPVSWLRIL